MGVDGAHGGGRRLILGSGEGSFAGELTLAEIDADADPTVNEISVRLGEAGIEIDLREGLPKPLIGKPLDRAAFLSDQLRIYRPILQVPERPDDPAPATLADFAEALVDGAARPTVSEIPAAYTYLGQFIAHDISRTRVTEAGHSLSLLPGALRFESLFGRPDAAQGANDGLDIIGPFDGDALGLTAAPAGFAPVPADLPRDMDGRPRIPEARNDSSLNLAQLHVLLIRFARAARTALPDLEAAAQETSIRRHLHTVVWDDYVRRLVPQAVTDDILANGRRLVATPALGGTQAFHVPPEFAWGAFQVAHAMIREKYQPWGFGPGEVSDPPGNATLATLLGQTFGGRGLVDGQLSDDWRINWDTMLGQPGAAAPTPAARAGTKLRPDVFLQPGRLFTVKDGEVPARFMNLALRTMQIGRKMKVPTGQALATLAHDAGADVTVLTQQELAAGLSPAAAALFNHVGRKRVSLAERTPLWFYCLRECELAGGESFGALGGRIVAETLHAAIEAAETGFFDAATGWVAGGGPRLPSRHPGRFDLYDLRALADTQ